MQIQFSREEQLVNQHTFARITFTLPFAHAVNAAANGVERWGSPEYLGARICHAMSACEC